MILPASFAFEKPSAISLGADGFSLIEVLLALFILSVGLLGIAQMQLSSLHHTEEAYRQSIATIQLSSLSERLQANPSDTARQNELTQWNTQNARLLPKGKGKYQCNAEHCTAQIQWLNGQSASMMFKP